MEKYGKTPLSTPMLNDIVMYRYYGKKTEDVLVTKIKKGDNFGDSDDVQNLKKNPSNIF